MNARQMRRWMIITFQGMIMLAIIVVTYFNFWCHDTFVEYMKTNQKYLELIPWLVGIGVAMTCYRDYIAQKQHDAVFGFYMNMRVYIKRFRVYWGEKYDDFENADIVKMLYRESVYNRIYNTRPNEERQNEFATLSKEFLDFLSNAKDNVPPLCGKGDFEGWYENQIVLAEALHYGARLCKTVYGAFDDEAHLKAFYTKIIDSVIYIEEKINKRIEEDATNAR